MVRHAWLLVSGLVWAAMVLLLFEREIRPYFEYSQPPNYRSILARKRLPEVERRRIELGAETLGEAETLLTPQADGGFRMETRMTLRMRPFMPAVALQDDRSHLVTRLRVDPNFELSEFRIRGTSQGIPLSITGRRLGSHLRVTYTLLGGLLQGDKLVEFPREATLADSFFPFQGGVRLSEGKKWRLRMLDLGSVASAGQGQGLSVTEMYAAVVGREAVEDRGREVMAYKVEVRADPTREFWDYVFWVDEEGTVLRQLLKFNNIACAVVLEHRAELTPEGAERHEWRVPDVRGGRGR